MSGVVPTTQTWPAETAVILPLASTVAILGARLTYIGTTAPTALPDASRTLISGDAEAPISTIGALSVEPPYVKVYGSTTDTVTSIVSGELGAPAASTRTAAWNEPSGSDAVLAASVMTYADPLGEMLAASHPVGSPVAYLVESIVTLVNGAPPPLVTMTVRDSGLDPSATCAAMLGASTTITGVSGALIANAADVAGERPGEEKESVRSPTGPVMESPLNGAMPAAADTDAWPMSVPPPDAMVAVIVADDEVTMLPAASCTSTTGCWLNGAPIGPPAGWRRTARTAGEPGVTVTSVDAVIDAPPVTTTLAVIVAVPTRAPVTVPSDTLATSGLLLDHATLAVTGRPAVFVTLARTVATAPD